MSEGAQWSELTDLRAVLRDLNRALSGHTLNADSLSPRQREQFTKERDAFELHLIGVFSDTYLHLLFLQQKKPSEYRTRATPHYHLSIHKLLRVKDLIEARIETPLPLSGEAVAVPSPRVGLIYFIECGGFIKIGFTGNLASRLSQIETSSPHSIKLLRQEPGSMDAEAAYHRRFASLRAKREWFRFEGELKEFLEGAS